MNFKRVVSVTVSLTAWAAIVPILLGESRKRDNHDEPIIIDNGPIKIDFNSKGDLLDPKTWFRNRMAPVLLVRVWLGRNPGTTYKVDYAAQTGPQYITFDVSRGESQTITFRPSQDQATPEAYIMTATHLKFEKDGLFPSTSRKLKVIADPMENPASVGREIYFLRIPGHEKPIPIRAGTVDPGAAVRVALCAKADKDHCPPE